MADFETIHSHFTPNYKPAPFILSKGVGCYVFDLEGNKFLDFSSGIAVNNLGHCHPQVVKAVQSQAEKLMHTSNLFWNQPAIDLATKLTELSFADEVFLTNSGTESMEAALKLARKFFFDQKKARKNFLAFEKGFHGRSFGALSATAKEAYRNPYEPVVPGFQFARFNDLDSINQITEETAAVIFEPVQGEAGVFPATKEFSHAIRKRCNETGTLLILDCIQVGLHRTDCLFGYESLEIEPDIICLSKALGGGMPIGAMLTKKEIGQSFQPGSHGSTFGGNPVSCAAAVAVLDVMTSESFQKDLHQNRQDFAHQIEQKIFSHPKVKEIRLKGMMLGIDLKVEDISEIFLKLRQKYVLVTRILPSSLRILPPLIATKKEFELFFERFLECLD